MSHVRLNQLRKRYGANHDATKAINGLDLSIEPGEFFVLLGPSGCGKTTTLRCIAGLERPDEGSIEIAGTLVAAPERGLFVPPERRDLGMVFQNYALWPHMTVEANVAYPVRARRSADDTGLVARRALRQVGLEALAGRYPAELSGGQQQRVALARALAASPQLLLFDEPLSNLDASLRLQLREQLRTLHRELGYTAVYVTHDQSEALALADRIAVMQGGRLAQLGTPQEIYARPASPFVASFVGFDNLLAVQDVRDSAGGLTLDLGLTRPLWLPGAKRGVNGVGQLAVRASDLLASPQAIAGSLALPEARVMDVQYLGGRYEALVHAGAVKLRVTLQAQDWLVPPAALVGPQTLHLQFAAQRCVLLAATPAKQHSQAEPAIAG